MTCEIYIKFICFYKCGFIGTQLHSFIYCLWLPSHNNIGEWSRMLFGPQNLKWKLGHLQRKFADHWAWVIRTKIVDSFQLGTVLSSFQVLSYLILIMTLWCVLLLPFYRWGKGESRGCVIFPKSHCWSVSELGLFYPHLSDSRVQVSPTTEHHTSWEQHPWASLAGLRWRPQIKIVYLRSKFFVNLLFENYVYVSLSWVCISSLKIVT